MTSITNGLSLLRAPLAFFFLFDNVYLRLSAIVLAMLTDSFDGYLARRYRATTRLGTILDPATDKFFVIFALGVFLFEGKLEAWQACAMLSRDFFLCVFALYLGLSGNWQSFEFKAIRWGKITTTLQFFILIALTMHCAIPGYIFCIFILFGSLAFIELCQAQVSRLL